MNDSLILAKLVKFVKLKLKLICFCVIHFDITFVLIVCLYQKGFDVFNALDLMENKVFLEKLKFGIGDGNLQYYLYNWKCPPMDPDKVSCRITLAFSRLP